MKFGSFQELRIANLLGFNPKEFGRIFAFVDYGNVQHWYEDQRRKSDGTRLKPNEIFYVDIWKLGKFLDSFVGHKRFYYGHIPSKPATLHIVALAKKCGFIKITKPVHRARHYLMPYDRIGDRVKVYKDDFGKDYILIPKCNFDVEITLDALRRLKDYDTFLLLSSDRDFEKLLLFLKRKNKKVILIGGGYISNDLRKYAHRFVHANRIKDSISSIKEIKARS